ncbi:SDR family NAD(P)-dependent oxidoreductase [Rhodocaloribacter sp.]
MRLSETYPKRRAFITGAASGLGRAMCECLAEDGWTLGMADRDAEGLASAAERIAAAGGTPVPVTLDVTDARAFTEAADAFVARAGGVDLVVNNAGIAAAGLLEESAVEDWEAIVGVNLLGVVYGCRAFVPHLRRQGGGRLLNVASAAAVAAGPYMTAYNATKAGVLALSETLYSELYDAGIRVSVALPTFFRTNIARNQRGDEVHRKITAKLLERSGLTARDAAAAILDAAGRGKLHILYPRHARVIWHWKRLFPKHYLRAMVKQSRATARYLERLKRRENAETPRPPESQRVRKSD